MEARWPLLPRAWAEPLVTWGAWRKEQQPWRPGCWNVGWCGGSRRGGNGWHCVRPGPRHGLGPREHALPAPAGQRGRGRAGRPVRQPQHFSLRSGSSTSGSPARNRASSQSGFRVQAQSNNTPRPFSWGLNPPSPSPSPRAPRSLPPPSFDQLARDIEAA